MKRRIISMLLALCMICTMLPFTALAAEQVDGGAFGDGLSWTLDSEGTLTISGSGPMEEAPWQTYQADIRNVVIADGITSIAESAFEYCENLESISIPDSVTKIGAYAFDSCHNLESVSIPDSVTEIERYAFYMCRSLTSVELPENLTVLEDSVFSWCVYLTEVTFPENLTQIGDYAFHYCRSLSDVAIPDSVTTIGEHAFFETDITRVVLPESLVSIGAYGFALCDLRHIVIPAGVQQIDDYALAYGNYTTILFEGDAPAIAENAFYGSEPVAFYPAGNETWTEDVMLNYGGYGTQWTDLSVASVAVEDMRFYENTNGSLDYDSDPDTGDEIGPYFCYDYYPSVTVTLTDGSVYRNQGNWMYIDGFEIPVSYFDDQSANTPWGIGDHAVTALFGQAETSFTITVVECPITAFEVEPLVLTEGVDGYWDGHWDENDNYLENTWFYYEIAPRVMTVYYKDGTSFTGSVDEIAGMFDTWMNCSSDQSYYSPWGVGTYTANAWFLGVSCDYQVTIQENPVERIEVSDLTVQEGADGYMEGHQDEDTGDWIENSWFRYNIYPETVTVYYKDGTSLSGTPDEIYGWTGYFVNFYDDQDYSNQWGVGSNTATAEYMGVTCEYQVIVEESPVERIEVEPVTLMEYADSYWEGHWDENVQEWIEHSWLRYSAYPETITVYYKDGTVWSGYVYELEAQTGNYVGYDDDQSYDNQWGIGTHTATVRFMGAACTYQVTIVENPVEYIEAEDITLMEGTGGYMNGHWDEEIGEWIDDTWYRYDFYEEIVTIYYKDGTILTGDAYDIYEQTGESVFWSSDQSYYNQWGVGVHTATADFMGITCEIQVTIEESPVERIEVGDIILTENVDGGMDGHWDEETGEWVEDSWFYYSVCPESVTIYYKDGTVLTGDVFDIYEQTGESVSWSSDQSYDNQWGVGVHTATARFLGRTCEYQVTIVEGEEEEYTVTYTSASISLAGDIGVNYYAQLSDNIVADEGAYMQFTVAGQTQIVPLSEAVVSTDANGVTTYRFTCRVAAKQMTEQITGQMYLSDGTTVGEAKVYSVKAYCDAAIPVYSQYEAYADLVDLMEAMLNYGAYSQIQFGCNTDDLANSNLTDTALPAITAADVDAYAHGATGSEAGISVASVSLLLESTTTIRFYFNLDGSKSIDEYTFYVDGVETVPVQASENQYYVDKVNVAAKDLDEMVTVTIGGLTVKYCGLSYVRQVAVLYPTYYSEALVNVAKALYAYSQAANAYFA